MTDRDTLTAYCAAIGADRLLVQAAGGNASWKDGNTLWVKGSGTWLADANSSDIFLPTDLDHLQRNLLNANYDVTPRALKDSVLRPSIETLFHALIPTKFVLHTHSIEILATLVRADAEAELTAKIGTWTDWIFVEYFKPGPMLAQAIQHELQRKPWAQVIFMKNHGIIIGADSVDEIDRRLREILSIFKQSVLYEGAAPKAAPKIPGYRVIEDAQVHALVLDDRLQTRLINDWALFPDHVVFLGSTAQMELKKCEEVEAQSTYLFVPDVAVYERHDITRAAQAQLLCFLDVILRQAEDITLSSLTHSDVLDLLSWDAEKFRQRLNT